MAALKIFLVLCLAVICHNGEAAEKDNELAIRELLILIIFIEVNS